MTELKSAPLSIVSNMPAMTRGKDPPLDQGIAQW